MSGGLVEDRKEAVLAVVLERRQVVEGFHVGVRNLELDVGVGVDALVVADLGREISPSLFRDSVIDARAVLWSLISPWILVVTQSSSRGRCYGLHPPRCRTPVRCRCGGNRVRWRGRRARRQRRHR
ncbi:hypothetical protein HMPREF3227_01058 [Corynebacterium sp. CMW7794]|nr:hypothetical protein HMPREF3227_01058 [Corynebacterium sp. CMW7794]